MEPFRSNNRLKIISGKQFWVEGELKFSPPRDPTKIIVDMSYRSLGGPAVALNAVTNCNCDKCMSCALRRLTAARSPSELRLSYLDPGVDKDEFICDYDDLLRRNQENNVPSFWGQLDEISLMYTTTDLDVYTTLEEAAEAGYDLPHVKRALRVACWQELFESGIRHQRLWLKSVLYKFKKDEIAKYLKKPRSIGDLGVGASLQGFIVTSLLKKAMIRHPITVDGYTAEFIGAPEVDVLDQVFAKLLSPVEKGYFCFFSDDSCFSFRHFGVLLSFNVDISGCDSSQGWVIFESLIRTAPAPLRDAFRVLKEQCELDIKIRSQHNADEKIRGRFDGPSLFSGSTLTTVINNLANILIFLQLVRTIGRFQPREYLPDEICRIFTFALEEIGYVVTGFSAEEVCQRPEDLQFLKYSPALGLTDQVYHAVLNPGVWCRSTGSCHGDYPGSSKLYTIEQRVASMQLSLLRGMYPRTTSPFIENVRLSALKHAHPDLADACNAIVRKQVEYKVEDDKRQAIEFSDEDLFRRYDLTPLDFAELYEFSHAGLYDHTSAPFASKILKKDYGYGTLTWTEASKKKGLW